MSGVTEAGATHTRCLAELAARDEDIFGGKSAGLGELLAAGIPVPPGFAVAAGAFLEHLSQSGIGPADAAPGQLRDAIRAAPMPAEVAEEVDRRYAQLTAALPDGGEPAVAVRSSALGEDGGEATFAGQQETYLWVRGPDGVRAAVRDCWASLYSDAAVSYRAHLGAAAPARPAMGVTVQVMVDAAIAGVMFTCNPVSGDPSMIAINASWGLGQAVVGGEVTPDDLLVSKVTGEVVRESIASKDVEYVPAPGGHGTERREVQGDRRMARCLQADALAALLEVGKRIERHFGCHQDVEWAIDRAGTLHVLQSRPVTGLPERPKTTPPQSALSLVMAKFGAG